MPTPSKTMTARQFDAALSKLGLSVYASAPLLGISLRQAQRYSAGETEVNPTVAKLLRAMLLLERTDF